MHSSVIIGTFSRTAYSRKLCVREINIGSLNIIGHNPTTLILITNQLSIRTICIFLIQIKAHKVLMTA